MEKPGTSRILTLSLFLSCLLWGVVNGQNGCEDCYRIDAGVIAGIIIGDVMITIMIAMTIYYFARRGVTDGTNGNELPQPTSKPKVDAESTYEELRGPEKGLYSELNPRHK
ncbi:TYRO protein tyrosine kinase-binding protein-like [Carcharodon carcharias]|uniref:TYRO protein tyrosine kinase-binding protein-like n=1 Tax=Carcharodon carcharias TaxID=13397 RepID=UPI001B7F0BB1|nr:TYRO protein tyrosine kinase-binding protein-like [Carcharodon carcharias]